MTIGLIVLRELVPFRLVDQEVLRRAAFPPARVVVVRRDLVEAELLVVVRADPLGRVDRALLQRRIDVAAGDLLRHHAELLQRLAGPAADAELETLEIIDGLDLLAEPAAHLAAGIAAKQRIDIGLLVELVHQLGAVAVVEPGILLAGVEAERNGAEQRPGRILADVVVHGGMARSRRCRFGPRRAPAAPARSRPRRIPGSETCCRSLRQRIWRTFRKNRKSVSSDFGPARRQPPFELRHRLCDGRRRHGRCGHPGAGNFEKFAAFHGCLPPYFTGASALVQCGTDRIDRSSRHLHRARRG